MNLNRGKQMSKILTGVLGSKNFIGFLRLQVIVPAFLFACYFPKTGFSEIVYDLVDGAAGSQNGRTLSGTITFDTACGTSCTAANITDFSFTVTGGGDDYTYSRTEPIDVIVTNGSMLNALSDRLDFTFGTTDAELSLLEYSSGFIPQVRWISGGRNLYIAYPPTGPSVWETTPPNGTVTIGTAMVPEPSTSLLLALAITTVLCLTPLSETPASRRSVNPLR
jgi:hypothetical protein